MNQVMKPSNHIAETETSVDREIERVARVLLSDSSNHAAKDKYRSLMQWRTHNLVKLPAIEEA